MEDAMTTESTRKDFFKLYGGTAPENYERFFVPTIGSPLAKDLVEAALLRSGERVLDVACGTGVVARMAKSKVGTGSVAGVDMNPGMLAVARATSGDHTEWYEARAEALPMKDASFDVVLCQLGLQFVADKPAALREMRRVLAPSGRLLLNVVGPLPRVFAVLEQSLERVVGAEPSKFVRLVFSMSDPSSLESGLKEAGFRHATASSATRRLELPPPKEFLWQYIRSTPLSAAVGQLTDEQRAALERQVVDGWSPLVVDGKLVCELPVITASTVA
jgi:ubiquinone/menaquinone biosynthesis C-methylase UbiE